MSEADSQGTSILLPDSRVTVFSRDSETLDVARALGDDWRFTRVSLDVEEGDVDTAIETYKEFSSPDLVIIQTDTVEESFSDKLEALAAQCEEGTAAIVVGPVNDVYLYRTMIDMGISDYLVKPVTAEVLGEVVVKTLIEKIGVTGSRLIAFIGAKGGVGTSVLAQGAACGAAEIAGQKTVLLDGCGGWSTLNVGLGFDPSTTLAEASKAAENEDEDSLKRMLHQVGDKLAVLASGGDVMLESAIDPDQFEKLTDILMMKYPVVIVDLSQASHAVQKTVLARANQINVVSTPTLVSLRQGRSLIQEIKAVRGGEDENIELVINMQGLAGKQEVAAKDIEDAMDMKVSTAIDFAPQVFLANESESRPITKDNDGKKIIEKTLMPVLSSVLGGDAPSQNSEKGADGSSGLFGGFLKKLSTK